MSKLDSLKEKISALREQLRAKADKIAFIRKWREMASATAVPSAHSLREIYRHGGTGTRIQVLLVFLFGFAALGSTGLAISKVMARFKSSVEHEKLKKDYAKEFEEFSKRVQSNAAVISIGRVTVNAYSSSGSPKFMSVDLWARMSDPAAAEFAQKNDLIFHDKAIEALEEIRMEKVSLLDEQGKTLARKRIREKLNRAMPKGNVEEVFFHNLVAQ